MAPECSFCKEDHRIVSKAFMAAMGITIDGHREIIGIDTYDNESKDTWAKFLSSLKDRGLKDVSIITSDCHNGLIAALKEVFPETAWQRCQYHFLKNILRETPKKYQAGIQTELREMFTAKTVEEARKLRDEIYNDYKDVAPKGMEIPDEGFEAAMTVMMLPEEMRRPIRTTNYVERENGELERRYAAIRIFPNVESINRLMGAVLMERNDLMGMRRALFSRTRCIDAIGKAKPKLIEIAHEQIKLLKAA